MSKIEGLGWDSAVEAAEGAKKKKGGGFQSMGLDKPLLDAILKQGFTVPTPIQRKAIPPMMQGNDIVAMARTGSGKTAAFLIPMLQKLKTHSKIVGIRGLVLSPTRELSLQILRHAFGLNKYLDLRFAALVGGNSLDSQFEILASNPDIVIATPGRLLHIMDEATLHLTSVTSVVLDEADRLFELGLQPQIVNIMQKIPEMAQRALFSATMPSVLAEFTNAGLHNPVIIRLDAETKVSEKLKQSAFLVRQDEKVAALIVILKRIIHVGESASNNSQALVFVESRFHVDYLQLILDQYMISNSAVHGQMDQEARRLAVRAFAHRETSVMIVTDVAARGIDLPHLDNVINFSFPFTPKLFVHRVGRVARAGRSGTAYSIITFEDFPYYVDLMHFLDRPLQCRKEDGDLLFTADDGCYGRIPEEQIQMELDFLHRLQDTDVEVQNLTKVIANAHKKFNRTKKKATNEAIREARRPEYAFDNTPLHPLMLDRLAQRSVDADRARFDLKRFKAKESVLELMTGEKMFEIKRPDTVQSLMAHEKSTAAAAAAEESRLAAIRMSDTERRSGSLPSTYPTGQHPPEAAAPAKSMTLAEKMLLRAQERKKRAREEDGEEVSAAAGVFFGRAGAANARDSEAGRRAELLALTDSGALGEGRVGAGARVLGKNEEDMETGKFRDEGFFMDLTRRESAGDAHYSVKDATMDISAETAQEEAAQRQVFAWSKKKNRYVKMHVNDAKAMLKGMKNEAGKAIDYKSKLDAYAKWTKKSNMRIQDVGEEEDLGAFQRARAAAVAAGGGGEDGEDGADNGEDYVDISNPNQGKKLRIGRKQRRLPKDGRVRTFEELSTIKRKAEKERTRLANRRAGKQSKKQKH